MAMKRMSTDLPLTGKKQKEDCTNNNLELFLNDVYEKECLFSVDNEEVEFIRTGVESLVQNIVDQVLEGDTLDQLLGENFGDEQRKIVDPETDGYVQDYLKNSLAEVHFKLGQNSYFKQLSHVKASYGSIIKAGSFYEGTKNGFPDEFDFIFPILSGTEETPNEIDLRGPLTSCIQLVGARNEGHLHYPSDQLDRINGRRLYFDKFLHVNGPSYVCQFIYENEHGKKKILADLVPAEKLYVHKKLRHYKYFKDFLKKPKSFRDQILSAECYLKTSLSKTVTLTETEVYFLKHILSKRHVKVYRILKYLINGHGHGEKLKAYNTEFLDMKRVAYSSFQIKTMIMDHHDECSNTDPESLGPCVLQVLDEMGKYEDINEFPRVVEVIYYTNYPYFCLFPYIKQLTEDLTRMQGSAVPYDSDSAKMQPLSQQYLNDIANVPADVIQKRLTSRSGKDWYKKFYEQKHPNVVHMGIEAVANKK